MRNIVISILIIFILLSVVFYRKYHQSKKLEVNNNIIQNNKSIEKFNSLNPMDLRDFDAKILNKEPNILLLDNFLTDEECDYIIKLGDPHIKKSEVCARGVLDQIKVEPRWQHILGKNLLQIHIKTRFY